MAKSKKLYIYLVQGTPKFKYDSYDSFVIVADSEETARNTHPSGNAGMGGGEWINHPKDATVTLLGVADEDVNPGVVLASYNAG